MKEKKKKKHLSILFMVLIIGGLIAINASAVFFYDLINVYLGGYGNSTTSIDFTKTSKIAEDIESEGIVLLKNEDKTLPLDVSKNNKINVFGWSSIDPVYTGGGSGSSNSISKAKNFYDSLKETGFEYNEDLYNTYREYKIGRENTNYWSAQYPYLNLIEPSIDVINPKLDAAYEFSSTALVFISRLGGEHQDLPKTQVKWNQEEDSSRTYLDVSKEEESLIEAVSNKFDKVIIIINSINAMNLNFLDNEKIDAALYVGAVGEYGTLAIGKALKGETTPSGKTVDTYAYDLTTAATYITSPDGHKTNSSTGVRVYNNSSKLEAIDKHYIDYRESIYVGYKWYETADKEGFWNSEFAKAKWNIKNGYKDVVQYPFGYGLSYTDFEWDIVSVSPASGTNITLDTEIEIKVAVTNVGDYKGADVVQIYYEPPYQKGKIEKASKNLIAYAKTEILDHKDGEAVSQLLTLKFKASDMKSYDFNDSNQNGFSGYELEKGEYKIYLSKDAHNIANLEKSTITYNIKDDIKMREVDGAVVENLFTGDDALDGGISLDGSNTNANILYLSRSNFSETFPNEVDENRNKSNKFPENGYLSNFKDTDEMPVQNQKGDLKIYENNKPNLDLIKELGSNYNDENWDALLDQMSINDLETLVTQGGYRTASIDSIGKPEFTDFDGPLGLNDSVMVSDSKAEYTFYPSSTVLAQTWNDKMAYIFGLSIGYEAGESNVSGWYAPACNLHRSPFGGRNFEYYSEDSLISGKMAANVIQGATNNGTYCYLKHFAVNETASIGNAASIGLYTWLTEQALREIYLKPFEIAVKEGHANAVMSAYNRIGATWCGGSYALLTSVLREEWKFRGSVITDAWTMSNTLYDMEQGIRAGNNLLLNSSRQPYSLKDKKTATAINCLRESAHDILFTYCNTIYRQDKYLKAKENGESIDGDIFSVQISNKAASSAFPYWLFGVIGLDIVSIALLTIWLQKILIKKKND